MPTLDWIGKTAVANFHNRVPFHLLQSNTDLSVGDPGSGNLLVQGDNLVALKALLPYYARQVKCIYIDPPYNTGNEGWIYNDAVKAPEISDWLGKAVGREAEDLSRHDKWLCMMYPRLQLLKSFLSDDGVIFVSIDDHEVSSLRLIMDEIFGPLNWMATFIWKRRVTPDSRNLNYISADHEYVLAYRRTAITRFKGQGKDLSKYKNPDDDPNGPWMSDNLTGLANAQERPNLHYNIIHPESGKSYPPHPSRGWIYGPETMAKLIEQGRILWPKSASGRPRLKRYITDMKNPTTGFSTILSAPANVDGTKTLGKILGPKTFAFPKPHGLIKILIDQVTEKNSIVMDSFAGSGTTGQAVLDLNKEDGGNRRFILVEMEAEICQQVTVERLKRVINGYANSDGLTDKLSEGLGGSFRYCNLGIPLFDENGSITKEVGFQSLAAHVYFSETGEPLNDHFSPKSPLLGIHNGTAIYLLYNGILEDKRPQGGNVLTRAAFDILPVHDGAKVIYGTSCRLGEERLKKENITFKQIPYEVRVF